MARRRFFVDSVRDGKAEVRGDDARHLTRVLRAEAGQRYEITDSQAAYLAEVQEAHASRVLFRVIESLESPELPARVTVLAALIKFDRFEWMIEKATELGVERIIPVAASRSEKGLAEASRKRLERWTRIARESSQQSRRLRAPEILPAVRFEASVAESADYRYFLDESGAPPLLGGLPAGRAARARFALLVGPEGGWTDEERQLAARLGWQSASLGPLILRAETATMAGAAILMNAWATDRRQK